MSCLELSPHLSLILGIFWSRVSAFAIIHWKERLLSLKLRVNATLPPLHPSNKVIYLTHAQHPKPVVAFFNLSFFYFSKKQIKQVHC